MERQGKNNPYRPSVDMGISELFMYSPALVFTKLRLREGTSLFYKYTH